MTEEKKLSVEVSNISESGSLKSEENSGSSFTYEEKKVSVDVSNISESGSLQSEENSGSSFYQWDEYREPIEIKFPGRYVLSDTEKGKSIVFYDPNFFEEDKASALMDLLLNTTNWQAKNVTIRGVKYRQPRLVAWYGPFPYSYSGTTLEAAEMPFYIFQIKKKVEKYLRKNGVNVKLNSVLLNRYRNNRDSVSWHSDDESSMGIFPTIASVSLGDTRRFEMRRKLKFFGDESSYTESDDYFILLNNGSLLIMDGSMQEDWQHRVPKENCYKDERINLTFRTVYKVERFLHSPKAEIKRSLERVPKVHRKKISFGTTSDTDAKSEVSVTESDDPEKNNSESSLKVEENTCEDAESESSLERVTKTQGENFSFQKTSDTDVKSEGSSVVCKTEDFRSVIDSKKPEEKNTKSSLKLESEICGEDETNSNKHFTSKTEEILIESDEDDDIIVISYKKRRTTDAKNSVKNIGNTDATTGKNKRICTSRQGIATNSLSNTVQKDFKIKTDSTCDADNRQTSTESCENNKFDSCELRDLLNYNLNLMNRKLFLNYAKAVKNRVLQNIDEFSLPAKAELEVLCELTHGSQTEKSQKIITRRMLSIVDKALKLSQGSTKACNADSRQTLTESCENNKFDSCELRDLLNYNVNLMNRKLFLNYAKAVKNRVLQNINEFSLPAKAELEVLCELIHGSQTEENQKTITRRMLSIVDKALKLSQGSSKACNADNRQTLTESCENNTSG